ncbi:guanine deaminase [Xylariales sp. PMI_506]|nr:guanine deaminase [Xylariales sp. PMI_506]
MSTSATVRNQLFLGSFIHSKKLDELEYLHDVAVFVDGHGKIVAVERDCDREKAEGVVYAKLGWDIAGVEVHTCKDGQFFFPGFIDTHIHAPQYPNAGIFGKSTLLDWLNTYTFPMEASLADLTKAQRVYTRCVRRTLAHGTTTAAYYATIDVASTNLLASLCFNLGQRAFVGRVCMDRLGPSYYVDESAEATLAKTRESIDYIRSLDPGFALVSPILTPRFAPACTEDVLRRLGALRAETDLPLQTHISENVGELALVRDLFYPGDSDTYGRSYAGVYDAFGMLTPKTVLAHAVHLSDAEADLIAARGSGISHCPCSNSALTSGEARVRWLLERGIGVGLGTDVSGGYSPSILTTARQAALVSRHLAMPRPPRSHRQHQGHHHASKGRDVDGEQKKETNKLGAADEDEDEDEEDGDEEEHERAKLSVDEVLYLATRGGAGILGLQDRVGAFEVGMEFDAQLISLGEVDSPAAGGDVVNDAPTNVDIFGWESWEERVAKWVYNGDDRNTERVWVKGRLVHARS